MDSSPAPNSRGDNDDGDGTATSEVEAASGGWDDIHIDVELDECDMELTSHGTPRQPAVLQEHQFGSREGPRSNGYDENEGTGEGGAEGENEPLMSHRGRAVKPEGRDSHGRSMGVKGRVVVGSEHDQKAAGLGRGLSLSPDPLEVAAPSQSGVSRRVVSASSAALVLREGADMASEDNRIKQRGKGAHGNEANKADASHGAHVRSMSGSGVGGALEVEGTDGASAPPLLARRLSICQILALSIFWWGFAVWMYMFIILLIPAQVAILAPDHKESALGFTLAAGAVVSTVVSPVIGSLSDHTWTRLGRRRPFMLAGVFGSATCVYGMYTASRLWVFIISFVAVQCFLTVAAAPFNGLVADLVSVQQRGVVSGIIGGGVALGNLAGALLGVGYHTLGKAWAYLAVYGLLILATLITVFGTEEPTRAQVAFAASGSGAEAGSPTTSAKRSAGCRASAKEFLAPFGRHDFRWVFLSRLLVQMGIYTVQEYLFFFLRYAVHLPGKLSPESGLSLIMLPLLLAACLAPLVAGCVSDRNGGRRKPLMYVAGVLMIGCNIALAYTREWKWLPYIGGAFGAGYGTFNAIDFAIALDVLGEGPDAAKDLGLWNLSMAIPLCFAAPIAGTILGQLNRADDASYGYKVLFLVAAGYLLAGTLGVARLRKVK